jgi:hypothetical protein
MFKPNTVCSLLICAFLLTRAQNASAYAGHYLPLNTKERSQRFVLKPQKGLRPDSKGSSILIGKQSLTSTLENNETLLLQGKDNNKKPFSIALSPRSYTVFSGDLDANGSEDLVLVFDTGGNGLAPSQHLLIYLFDTQGRPFPLTVEGYFATDAKGLPDLLDLNRDGKAELVYMHYQQGVWITDLYLANNGFWKPVSGPFAGKTYPLYTRFTQRPNRRPVAAPNPRPFRPNFSTSLLVFEGQLNSLSWANVAQSENITLSLTAKDKPALQCQPDSWSSTFTTVIDNKQGRQIASLDTPEVVQKRLEELTRTPHQLKVFGKRSPERCSPEILWVTH